MKGKEMADGEQAPTKEKLIDFIYNLTNEEAEKIILLLQDIKKEQA